MNKQEYDDGYKAAIESIKQQLQSNGGNSNSSMSQPDPRMDTDLGKQQGQSGQGSQGSSNGQQSQQQGQNGQGGNSRDDKSKAGQGKNQGVVQPEDCEGPAGLNNVPGTAGGMIDRQTGEEMVKKEGYEPSAGNDGSIEKEWKDAAIKAASKLKGDSAGALASKILGIYKTSTDWKKALRSIVGHAISPEDRRQAYANKNILISQNRIARTDKDKYDNMEYMMAWIDSSGSMSDDQLKMCLSEVYAVALAKKPIKLVVIQCDTKIQDIKEYHDINELKRDIVKATVKGRGGTDFKACWELLKTDKKYKRTAAELVMLFTDGYCDQYKRDPRTMNNLCWVIIDNPSFKLDKPDARTKCIHIKSADVK